MLLVVISQMNVLLFAASVRFVDTAVVYAAPMLALMWLVLFTDIAVANPPLAARRYPGRDQPYNARGFCADRLLAIPMYSSLISIPIGFLNKCCATW